MLVDLGRNDVGRVARFGTVRTTELLTLSRSLFCIVKWCFAAIV